MKDEVGGMKWLDGMWTCEGWGGGAPEGWGGQCWRGESDTEKLAASLPCELYLALTDLVDMKMA